MKYQQIITKDPDKRDDKPCIRGLRITVYDVLGYLAGRMSIAEILADFPDLTEEDIKACLAFVADVAPINEALADLDTGDRGVAFDEFVDDFRRRHQIPTDE